MGQPFLSVVIPAYNESLRLGKSLEKIRRYMKSKDFPSELIVVDDGSVDGTPDLLRERGGEDDEAVKLPRPSDLNKKVHVTAKGVTEDEIRVAAVVTKTYNPTGDDFSVVVDGITAYFKMVDRDGFLCFPDEHQLGLDVLVRVARNTAGSQ